MARSTGSGPLYSFFCSPTTRTHAVVAKGGPTQLMPTADMTEASGNGCPGGGRRASRRLGAGWRASSRTVRVDCAQGAFVSWEMHRLALSGSLQPCSLSRCRGRRPVAAPGGSGGVRSHRGSGACGAESSVPPSTEGRLQVVRG